MVVYEDEVVLLTDQGEYTGLGIRAIEMIRVLKPSFPNIKLASMSYFGSHIPGASVFSRYKTNKLYQVPYIKYKNSHTIRKEKLLLDKNLHFLGYDYGLTKFSRNSVMTIHEYYYILRGMLDAPTPLEFAKEILFNLGEMKIKYYSKFAKEIITISNNTAKQVKKSMNRDSTVVYMTVDRRIFHPRNQRESRVKLGLPLEKRIILNVSSGGSNKKINLMNRIAANLPENVVFVKIGHPLSSKDTVNKHKVNRDEYPLYFNSADLYLHTSSNEGFGVPLLESMASGLPVIAAGTQISKEVLGDSASLLIDDINDPHSYIEKIEYGLDKLVINELSAEFLERSNFFSDERARNALTKVYKKAFNL